MRTGYWRSSATPLTRYDICQSRRSQVLTPTICLFYTLQWRRFIQTGDSVTFSSFSYSCLHPNWHIQVSALHALTQALALFRPWLSLPSQANALKCLLPQSVLTLTSYVSPSTQWFFLVTNASLPLWFFCLQTGHCALGMIFTVNTVNLTVEKCFVTVQSSVNAVAFATDTTLGTGYTTRVGVPP